jgi:hypothetical protein
MPTAPLTDAEKHRSVDAGAESRIILCNENLYCLWADKRAGRVLQLQAREARAICPLQSLLERTARSVGKRAPSGGREATDRVPQTAPRACRSGGAQLGCEVRESVRKGSVRATSRRPCPEGRLPAGAAGGESTSTCCWSVDSFHSARAASPSLRVLRRQGDPGRAHCTRGSGRHERSREPGGSLRSVQPEQGYEDARRVESLCLPHL